MVSNSQMMDNQRQPYVPAPPPPPSQQGNHSQYPPPPPRLYAGASIPPPPPGPHPATLPPGTVYGLPGGWQQSWGRPGQTLPPPPPMGQHPPYGMNPRGQSQLSILGPQRREELPMLSATFIPSGDSFGPGVGIPPLDDLYTHGRFNNYEPAKYSDENLAGSVTPAVAHDPGHTALPAPDLVTRENRAASIAGNRVPFTLNMKDANVPMSPGPLTATRINPLTSEGTISGRQRAHSSVVTQSVSSEQANQWPLERVLSWMAANGFSKDWQETFRTLRLEKADFLELGRGSSGRGNLVKMHQFIYPQLAKVCTNNNTGWDQSREREEGKRLRRLVGRISESDGPGSAGSGHRRRESGIASASTEGNVENSPHLPKYDLYTPSTAGPDGSPGRPDFGIAFDTRASQPRSSTLPVFPKQASSVSTPADGRHPDSFSGPQNRSDLTKNIMNGLGGRGRHSPNPSSDSSSGLAPRQVDNSPGGSPGLLNAVPAPAQSQPNLTLRGDHLKTNSADSFLKATGFPRAAGSGNVVTTDVPTSGRFYENRRDGQELNRPEGQRANSNEHAPGSSNQDHGKGLLRKFMRGRKHDHSTAEDALLESPTSPASFRNMLPNLPFSKANANVSDSALATRSVSDTAAPEGEHSDLTTRNAAKAPRKYVLATPDYWNYRVFDVTDVDSATTLRNLICTELAIPDTNDPQIFVTELGQTEHEEPLTDVMLVSARNNADATGNLKFFVSGLTLSAGPVAPPGGLGLSMPRATSNARPDLAFRKGAGPLIFDGDSDEVERTDEAALHKAAEEWRRETERKQKAYLESRQRQKEPGARGSGIIDFDSPRMSPFEEKKTENLVPHRKPPTAPSESHTLTKVNSLRTKSEHRNRGSGDLSKRFSDPIVEDGDNASKKRMSGGPTQGIGAALANLARVAGAPAVPGDQSRARSMQSVEFGQRSGSPGVPDRGSAKPQNAAVQALRGPQPSPGVSPSMGHGPRPDFNRTQSEKSDLFRETNVSFMSSPQIQAKEDNEDDDDDSDDGLFAIPITTNKVTPKKGDQRPALTVDTDQTHPRAKSVAFKSPHSSGAGPSAPTTVVNDSTGGGEKSGSARDRRLPSSGSAASAVWDSAISPEEARRADPFDSDVWAKRPDSFVSDIWANRPAVENVVDRLDQFFPGVDLDRPYLEEAGDSASPAGPADRNPGEDLIGSLRSRLTFGTQGLDLSFSKDRNESDTLGSDESTLKARDRDKAVSVASRQMSRASGLGRMKSIREVAQKRNDVARGPSVSYRAPQVPSGSIVRRKSTKMFGANIVQIKPQRGSNRLSTLDPIPQEDIPTDDTPKRQATFKIIRGQLIGKGTFGRVYLGMNATTGDFLAVKQVEVNHKAAAQDKDRIKEMVKAMDQEIDTMQHLEHPNIVQYLGCERKEFAISIYLEYISGGSVGSCLRKHGKFEEPVVRSLTQQTLSGLEYLHDERILHRDLKADNILLDLDGSCKISDFGISKKSDDIYGNDVTNSMQGSVFWMAPEVVRSQGQGYSAKVDIWSLGCVVLEMFAGKRPWSKEEAIGAIFKLGNLQQAPPIPDDVRDTATVDGLNFMYDCFQVNPSDRPTAKVLLRHSSFCVPDPYFNFFDTHLAAKLRNANLMPGGA